MRVAVVKRKICNQLIQQVGEFPPLPAIVSKILMVTSDPESSMDELKVLVEAEMALASSILKLANSPFFGLCREVSSINHALAVLGLEEVTNLVLAKAMFNTFKGFRNKGDFVNSLWKHSFHTGLAATVIGKRLGYGSSDFFVAGLIHDIGKMVIYLALNSDNLGKLYHGVSTLDETSAEFNRLGVDHQYLGAELVRGWLFPESLLCGVGFHHHPQDAPSFIEVPLILSLADMLIHYIELRDAGDQDVVLETDLLEKLDTQSFLTFGFDLNSASLELVLADVEEALAAADDIAGLLEG